MDKLVALIAELEHTNRDTFQTLDAIVDFESKDEKLNWIQKTIAELVQNKDKREDQSDAQ
ncbi:TPA: hypothetical protein ACN976_000416 [Vibrio campbellii]